jgi:hypothetical protein
LGEFTLSRDIETDSQLTDRFLDTSHDPHGVWKTAIGDPPRRISLLNPQLNLGVIRWGTYSMPTHAFSEYMRGQRGQVLSVAYWFIALICSLPALLWWRNRRKRNTRGFPIQQSSVAVESEGGTEVDGRR